MIALLSFPFQGLVSWDPACNKGVPTVLVDVAEYEEFILNTLGAVITQSGMQTKRQFNRRGSAFQSGSASGFSQQTGTATSSFESGTNQQFTSEGQFSQQTGSASQSGFTSNQLFGSASHSSQQSTSTSEQLGVTSQSSPQTGFSQQTGSGQQTGFSQQAGFSQQTGSGQQTGFSQQAGSSQQFSHQSGGQFIEVPRPTSGSSILAPPGGGHQVDPYLTGVGGGFSQSQFTTQDQRPFQPPV